MKILITISLTILIFNQTFAQDKKFKPYLGQKLPGIVSELFAPEIIATGFNERDITISPDGKEIFYGLLTSKHITIMQIKFENNKWSEPRVAPFADDSRYFFLEPCFSPDGRTIFFLSTCPPIGMKPKPRWFYQNIWASDKQPDGSWGEIYMIDTIVNNENNQFYPSVTKTGTLYFTKSNEKTNKSAVYRSQKIEGKYSTPEMLPETINKEGTNVFNAFISPDESFLIACVDGRNNDINPGFVNYYIFFRDEKDNWSEGIPFGSEINFKGSNAISSSVSPDGKYLFFSAQKTSIEIEEKMKTKTLKNMIDILNSPQNGNQDIYWIDAKIIEILRPKK